MNYASRLDSGKLIRRYKRFLADVEIAPGEVITIHCPNTGSMLHCAEPGYEVWFSTSDNPKRKYPHTWELARDQSGHMIGINTGRANHLVEEALGAGVISELRHYDAWRKEVKYGEQNSRVDFLLSSQGQADCYLEVKSVTLHDRDHPGQGFFPDAVSTRGTRHLEELTGMVAQGYQAALLYCVQHTGIRRVSAAAHIDSAYAAAVAKAEAAGVMILAYGCEISPQGITLTESLSWRPGAEDPHAD